MKRAILYLMVGYPGSGKTTAARYIRELTGAVHIWADEERANMFERPDHSWEESQKLYKVLNQRAAELLAEGRSVIFDANFNFRMNRKKLRRIAAEQGADSRIIWVQVPEQLAYERAVTAAKDQPTRFFGNMPHDSFRRVSGNLQPPKPDEDPVILDGTRISESYVAQRLGLKK
jgi:predicted kinase